MSIKNRLNKIEQNMPCQECGASKDTPNKNFVAIYPDEDLEENEVVQGCSTCGKSPGVYRVVYEDLDPSQIKN